MYIPIVVNLGCGVYKMVPCRNSKKMCCLYTEATSRGICLALGYRESEFHMLMRVSDQLICSRYLPASIHGCVAVVNGAPQEDACFHRGGS
jgi:hypothetical protein